MRNRNVVRPELLSDSIIFSLFQSCGARAGGDRGRVWT